MRIAVLDDYQQVALQMADWSAVQVRARVEVFHDHLHGDGEVVARLLPFEIVCAMRERTPLSRARLEKLPNLKLIASTGARNASIDLKAAEELGIRVVNTGYNSIPTIEMTWTLILGLMRHVVDEATSLRNGGWQISLGTELRGKTLALLGLGNIGREVAAIGRAFGMRLIAWSQNLTAEKAAQSGAALVSKEELFQQADVLSVHLVLSHRTRGLVDAALLNSMKKTARLVNTSRAPIVDQAALLKLLEEERIAGAAVDVYEEEPLPADHPFRSLKNLLATPHVGYGSEELYRLFYGDTVKNILAYLDEAPGNL